MAEYLVVASCTDRALRAAYIIADTEASARDSMSAHVSLTTRASIVDYIVLAGSASVLREPETGRTMRLNARDYI